MTHVRIALLGGLALSLFVLPAPAHQAASGWQYPMECCHDRDCAPVAADDVMEFHDHFALMNTGEAVSRSAARRSGDGGYHICRAPNGAILCFFYPPRSM